MRDSSSCSLWATLDMNLSFGCRNNACSRLMYIIVESMSLCPSMDLTCRMSFLSWYSMVPFQCRNVWKVICWSLGLLSFVAAVLRWLVR